LSSYEFSLSFYPTVAILLRKIAPCGSASIAAWYDNENSYTMNESPLENSGALFFIELFMFCVKII